MKLRDDLATWAHVPFAHTPFTPSPEAKVARKMLERDGEEVARATSIVRYAPGSAFPEHVHERGEEFIVLDGVFADEHGSYPKHTYVRNPPGSSHRPGSKGGYTIFVKLRQFEPSDTRRCVIELDDAPLLEAGPTHTLLHAFGGERVSLVRLAAGATVDLDSHTLGAEIFVLRGSVHVGAMHCGVWAWLRAPRMTERLHSQIGCVFWLKQGHLPAETKCVR
jgi:quercetin dioxygenase-like cupin family protein